jgi:hypothetical protein
MARSLLATGCTLQRPATQPLPCSVYQAIQRGAIAINADGVTNEAQAAYMTEQMARALRQWIELIEALDDSDQPCIFRCSGDACPEGITIFLLTDNTSKFDRYALCQPSIRCCHAASL